jgi:hypothetical protein
VADIKIIELSSAKLEELVDLKAEADKGDIKAFKTLRVRGGKCPWPQICH